MSVKIKNALIKTFTYLLAGGGIVAILVFQYFSHNVSMPTWIKIIIPCLLALLITFLVCYKSIKEKINRRLIAVETAKELGKPGKTGSIMSNLLEAIGIIVPMILISAIFIIGGQYLVRTGIVLLEMLAIYLIVIIGNIICDANKRAEMKRKELEKTEAFANTIADKIENLPKKYE